MQNHSAAEFVSIALWPASVVARSASRTTFLTRNDSLAKPMLKYRRRGFTILQRPTVIIVIANLAAITAAANSGMQNRDRASAGQYAARQALTAISTYAAQTARGQHSSVVRALAKRQE